MVDPTVELPKVRCPVLIASGVFDFAAVPTAWHKIKDLLSNHTYVAFEKSGHFLISSSKSCSTRHCDNG